MRGRSRGGRGHWNDAGGDWPGEWEARGMGRFGRGRGRMFDGGELRLLLLHLIGEEPRHGYDLIRAVEALSGGAYAPSPGVVYPTLNLLKDLGLVREADSDNQRKLFAITPEGEAHLKEHAEAIAEMRRRLGSLAKVRERTDSAPVRRAMLNLKTALLEKLSAGADRETVLKVVALIDEAAQKIERL